MNILKSLSTTALLFAVGFSTTPSAQADTIIRKSLDIHICNDHDVLVGGNYDQINGTEHESCDDEKLYYPKSYQELAASKRIVHDYDNNYIAYDPSGKVYRCTLDNSNIYRWKWNCLRDRSLE